VPALLRHSLIDEILDARREVAHGDDKGFEGYRNHAHRVQNFARAISSPTAEDEEKLAIAAAFHDLYVFDGLDYLEPSIEDAARYLRETGREAWERQVALTPTTTASGGIAARTRRWWSRSAGRIGTTSASGL
jgi:hypothetical protein